MSLGGAGDVGENAHDINVLRAASETTLSNSKSSGGNIKLLAFTRKGRSKQLQKCIKHSGTPAITIDYAHDGRDEFDIATRPTSFAVVDGVAKSSVVDRLNYSVVDMLMAVFSTVCYLADIALEARLAAFYYAAATTSTDDAQLNSVEGDDGSCQSSKLPSQSSYMIWFYVTLAFIIFPGIICGLCSLSWHITDFRMQRRKNKESGQQHQQSVSLFRYAIRFVMPLLLLGPVLHNIEAILFALAAKTIRRTKSGDVAEKQRRQIFLYEQALFEDADAALLRIIECFLESLPQLVLQLHIVLASANLGAPAGAAGKTLCYWKNSKDAATGSDDPICSFVLVKVAEWFPSLPLAIDCQLALQFVSMAATLLAAAWALVSYQKALRRFLFSHRRLPLFPSGCVLFLAHACLISGRVLAIALFIQVFGWMILFGILLAHAIIMFLWLQCGCMMDSKRRSKLPDGFCCADSILVRAFFNAVLALIYTTAYVNVFDSPTRYRYVFFFGLTLVENVAFLLSWFFLTNSYFSVTEFSTLVYLLVTGLSLVFGGVLFLMIYYKFFHPNVFHKLKVTSCCSRIRKEKTADDRDSNCTCE